MKRRDFIAGLGSAAAWATAARAQQPAMPVIGYLSGRSSESDQSMLAAIRRGLKELGYEEDRNLAIEYRFADGEYDRVRTLAAELIRRRVNAVVVAGVRFASEPAIQELRASEIPIVFITGSDPVRTGLVAGINRPRGNLTGVNTFASALTGKIFSLLRELVPHATAIGMIQDAALSGADGGVADDGIDAAAALGVRLDLLKAGSESEIERSFAAMSERHVGAVHIPTSAFFTSRARLFATLAIRYKLPTSYARREFAEAGGLMSYGWDVGESYRIAGNYAGRILMGTKPADLPVVQPAKFELVINLKTAKALGLTIPETLLATADEVIQ